MNVPFKIYMKAVWRVVPAVSIIVVMALALSAHTHPLTALLLTGIVASFLLHRRREDFRALQAVFAATYRTKKKESGHGKNPKKAGSSNTGSNVIPFRRR